MSASIGASYVRRQGYAPAAVTVHSSPISERLEFKDFPIVEVACGVEFAPIDGVDAMLVGKYWALHKERFGFPHREAGDRGSMGGAAYHTWLVSESGEFALELESRRFAVHWRKRDNTYPHFSDLDGEEGVLTMSLREIDAYKKFCEAQVPRSSLAPTRLELTKVDHLVEGQNFVDFAHLARAVPLVHGLASFCGAEPARIDARSFATRDGMDIAFRLRTIDGAGPLHVAIETRVSRSWTWKPESSTKDLVIPFTVMNALANEVFFIITGDPASAAAPASMFGSARG